MFEVIYRGFDGLDVAFQGALRRDLVEQLDAAKAEAQERARPILVEYRSMRFLLAETGAPNGYAFRCDTGDDGAIWFFKRGMSGADWNIRVSVKSMALERSASARLSDITSLNGPVLKIAHAQKRLAMTTTFRFDRARTEV